MSRTILGARFVAPAILLLVSAGLSSAAVVGDPSSLHPASVLIDFENIPVGTSEPIIVGGVTISTFNREGSIAPRQVAALGGQQTSHPGIFEGHYFAPGRHDFRIEFANPVSQVGLGVNDANYEGNVLIAFDAAGDVLEFVLSAAGDPNFPTGPVGGSHSTFVGFMRPTADIAHIELHNVFDIPARKTDVLAIDSIRYFGGGGTGVIPEPGSIVLLGIGCLALGIVWRRQRLPRRAQA